MGLLEKKVAVSASPTRQVRVSVPMDAGRWGRTPLPNHRGSAESRSDTLRQITDNAFVGNAFARVVVVGAQLW
jgi:hypothetical protein